MGIEVGGVKISILLYADDIVLLADSVTDLKLGMKIATEWGKKWQCSFNQSKSKVVIFGMRGIGNVSWVLGGAEIE